MPQPFLPYGRQDISDKDKQVVLEALEHPYLTTGPKVVEFESAFASYVKAPHAVSFANATAALHIACLALGVKPGDTVLTPTMSFAASTNCAAYAGARIEFMDCDPNTGLVTKATFLEAARRAENAGHPAKAAVVVHLNGDMADMAAIHDEAQARGIKLVEDACHALGTTYLDSEGRVQSVGACQYSDASCYSFHPVKTITTGEGGMLSLKDANLAEHVSLLRSHGITRDEQRFEIPELALDENGKPNPWYYEMHMLGFNYRLTDIACALGLSQLSRMEQIADKRRRLKQTYDRLFEGINLPVSIIKSADGVDAVRHLYPVLIDFEEAGISRAAFCNALRDLGIGTQVHYIPTHMQPYYVKAYGEQTLAGSESYYARVVSLPFYPGLEESDLERVVEAVKTVLTDPKL